VSADHGGKGLVFAQLGVVPSATSERQPASLLSMRPHPDARPAAGGGQGIQGGPATCKLKGDDSIQRGGDRVKQRPSLKGVISKPYLGG